VNSILQGVNNQPKWEQQAEPVVYLQGSLKYASSVTLVLDPSKAHVSPQFQFKLDDLGDSLTNKAKCSNSQVVAPETVSPWPRKKNEHSTISKKEPLLSMLGNTTGGAGATDMKVPLMNFPAQIPRMPPEDNFVFNE
jgi:hypothetical protein